MELRVDSRSHVPVHVQLQEQLKHLILTGELAVGSRLPSIRMLAGYLRINRNTVARVVAELEREGFLETRRGSGTYVLDPPVDAEGMERQRFLERVMRQAAEEGVPVEELGYALLARAGSRVPGRATILFVECSGPELEQYAAELEDRLPVRVEGVLLEDLRERLAREEGASLPWRLAVTTFYHVHEVEELMEPRGIETVALLAEATLDGITRLAELPAGTRVGVLGNSRTCSDNLLSSLVGAGMDHLELFQVYEDVGRDLEEQLKETEVVVCSSPMYRRLATLGLPPGTEVILQDRTLDKGGVEMLGRMLRSLPREVVDEGDRR
ncbi:GntR family transcriptional regulator [Rubrobacter marinus]|uniref:GntR family transcriptional regulator n=1 Tax=Rubrobacter marinus TaxID=2653852 RepID=A0A6G8PZ01_9ACTN|nr:GntR family transcriptional regulator [Rubrobacter marinus]QIN79400.1 GntR family transcriptional regulator [Rubrobacter marinus]